MFYIYCALTLEASTAFVSCTHFCVEKLAKFSLESDLKWLQHRVRGIPL
jgi:hypothetical protein